MRSRDLVTPLIVAGILVATVLGVMDVVKGPPKKIVTVVKTITVTTKMTAAGCEKIKSLEPESQVVDEYGESDPQSGSYFENDPFTVTFTYAYDAAWYRIAGSRECDVYYGPQHRVVAVDLELLKQPDMPG